MWAGWGVNFVFSWKTDSQQPDAVRKLFAQIMALRDAESSIDRTARDRP